MTDVKVSYYPLDDIHREFLKYAPAYAQEQAKEAIWKILDLQKQGIIRDGIYYVVLVDLVGSTKFGASHGNEQLAARIKRFITYSFDAFNGDGRVARPFSFAPTDPSMRLSRTRLLPRFVRIIQREPPACEGYAHAEGESVRATG